MRLTLDLGVPPSGGPLTLIPPAFDIPLPPLAPAVFAPIQREPPPPALELFDLDEHFAGERARLATLANRCTDEDMEFFVREAAGVVGISSRLAPGHKASAREVLDHALRALVNYKRLAPEPESVLFGGPPSHSQEVAGLLHGGAPLRHSTGAAGLNLKGAGFHS
jgi:hypothetical protein